jgi:hypothetical protein
MNLFLISGGSIFYNKILQQLLQEFPLLNWDSSCWEKGKCWGDWYTKHSKYIQKNLYK